MIPYVYIDDKNKDILILGERQTYKDYMIPHSQQKPNVLLILHNHEKDLQ